MAPEEFVRLTRPFPEPHLLVWETGVVVAANQAAVLLFGFESQLPAGVAMPALVADAPARVLAYLGNCASSGSFLPGSLSLPGPGGVTARYHCEGAAIQPRGSETGALLLLRLRPHEEASRRFLRLNRKIEELTREIQERERTEEELQVQAVQLEESAAEMERMVQELEAQKEDALRARAEAERAVERMTVLQRITAALSEAVTVDEVAAVIVDEGAVALRARTATLALLADDRKSLRIVRSAGLPADVVERWQRIPPESRTPLADAARTGTAIFLESAAERRERYPLMEEVRRAVGTGSLAAVPVIAGGVPIGGLAFSLVKSRRFDAEERHLIASLGRQCGLAMERARLYEAERTAHARVETAVRRVQILAETGVLLSSSLDPDWMLQDLADLCTSNLADYCVAYLRSEDGTIRRVAGSHADPSREHLLRELQSLDPPDPEAPTGAGGVLRTGKSILAADIPDELLAASARDAEHLRILRELRPSSSIVVPLEARGRTLGAIALATVAEGRPRFNEEDLELVEELARRAALALDNLRLLREAQEANRAKADFLAVMSHELRTPLNAIIGYADLLREGIAGPVSERQVGPLERIERSARHLTTIISEILAYSRLEVGRDRVTLERVDLVALSGEVAELIEPEARERGLHLRLEVPPAAVQVETDAAKVRQILLNLLGNAVKFTETGSVRLSLLPDGEWVRLSVEDTGIGIAPEDLEQIFEPFWQVDRGTTRRAGGTGLGLTITRRLARLLGGDLAVESVPGRGSIFTLLVPRRVE